MGYFYGTSGPTSLTTCNSKLVQANSLFTAAGAKITEFSNGTFYGTTDKTDLKSKLQTAQGNSILQEVADKYYCCPLIKTGYFFDYSTQSCRWKSVTTTVGSCDDCVTKLVFNPKNNDGVLFNYKSSDTTSLDLSLDYILNFDCDIFTSKCIKDNSEINELNSKILNLQNQINAKTTQCTALASDVTNKQTLFNSLCYVIVKGSGVVSMAYYNYQSKITYIKTTPTLPNGNYCLTELGLNLWREVIGETKYSNYISDYGCSTNTYSQTDVDNFYTRVSEATLQGGITTKDYIITTGNGSCDKKIAFNNINIAKIASRDCTTELGILNTQLTDLQAQLSTLKGDATGNESIANLEKLQLTFNLEYEKSPGVYEVIYSENLFNIGQGNLMKYIIENSPKTGILISGTSAGGILKPLYAFDIGDYEVPMTCPRGRDIFIDALYTEEYIGNYTEPTTTEERNTLNKTLHGWYNSEWLTYNVSLTGKTILDTINNKKIRISISIDNCCMNLSLLADNLKINKYTETIDNEEIIISEAPKFELERVLDNKKSWVSYENTSTDRNLDLTFRETEYEIYDYRLAVNTKEIDLKIDAANAIEEDVLCFLNNDCLLSGITCDSGCTTCNGCEYVDLDAKLTTDIALINNVDEFKKAITSELIDVKNRQSISSYPTLKVLYERYLGNCDGCDLITNRFRYEDTQKFADLVSEHWIDLVEQFVPATTIWGSTEVYRNTVFDQQKYKYRKMPIFTYPENGVFDYNVLAYDSNVEIINLKLTSETPPEKLEASATTVNFQSLNQSDETPRSNSTQPLYYTYEVNKSIDSYGDITQQQLDTLNSQISIMNEDAGNNYFASTTGTTSYGVYIANYNCSPESLGKVNVSTLANSSRNQPRNY
jgi:hypothetical protein